jgi:hypothetical protein
MAIRTTSALLAAAIAIGPFAPARADAVVRSVSIEEVAATFVRFGLKDVRETSPDPRFGTVHGVRPDGFTVAGTLYGCGPEGCVGLGLTSPMPTRAMQYARIIEGSIERNAVGFDAWVQEEGSIVVIETYLTFDGGVSDTLLPSTVNALMRVVDQTKDFMLKDDPGVREVWPKESSG